IPVIPVVPAEVFVAPADLIVAPEVGAVSVISPTRVLNLVDYSSFSDSDPSEDSLPVAPELPLVSRFLCYDDSKADNSSSSGSSLDSLSDISSRLSSNSYSNSSSVYSSGCDALDLGVSDRVRAPNEDGLGMELRLLLVVLGRTRRSLRQRPVREARWRSKRAGLADRVRSLGRENLRVRALLCIEKDRRQLEAWQLVASRERAGLADRVWSLGWENLRVRALLCIKRDCVDSLRRHMALSQEDYC
nr:hypothetical protein [Tanacetum cinerariifolium]